MKKYDLAVWGATGNIGRRVVTLLFKKQKSYSSLNILLIARNREKLDALIHELGAQNVFSTTTADSHHYEKVAAISQNTRLILSCVGPYAQHGSQIVQSCAESGTDYVDVSGESLWLREMMNRYHHKAQETGARIVFSCGFDSIPSDLSVYALQKLARSVLGYSIPYVKARIQRMKTIPLSSGTLAAHDGLMKKAFLTPSILAFLRNPFGLTTGFTGPPQPPSELVKFDDELGTQASPFWGAAINSKIVHCSNQLLGFSYGRHFLYDEMLAVDRYGRNAEFIKELGQFPTREQTTEKKRHSHDEKGSWLTFFHGLQGGKEVIRVRVSCEQDPGYGTSSALAVESALCLLEEPIVTPGGMWTASSCMGDSLLERLSRKQIIDISWEIFAS